MGRGPIKNRKTNKKKAVYQTAMERLIIVINWENRKENTSVTGIERYNKYWTNLQNEKWPIHTYSMYQKDKRCNGNVIQMKPWICGKTKKKYQTR